MQWRKSPPELVELFDRVLPDDARAERRKMFGYPCSFANGNMFAGLHQENLILRLGEKDRAEIAKITGTAPFEPMAGRVMKEYVVAGEKLLARPTELRRWVERAFDYALGLPAKQGKRKTSLRPRRAPKRRAARA